VFRSRTLSRLVLAASATLVPLGCNSPNDSDPTELGISAANAPSVAAQGVSSVELLSGMAELTDSFTSVVESGNAALIPCDSGSIDVVVEDSAPLGVLSSGDSATLTFDGCVVTVGGRSVALNGVISFTATEVTGAAGAAFSLVLDCTYDGLTVIGFKSIFAIDGGFTVDTRSTDGETITRVVSGERFSAFSVAPNQVFSGTLLDFREERTLNQTTGAYTLSLSAGATGNRIFGTVRYETTIPFQGLDPNDPDTGELEVTGTNGGKLTFVVVDNIAVQLLVDVNGDGIPEATIDTTWDFLQNETP